MVVPITKSQKTSALKLKIFLKLWWSTWWHKTHASQKPNYEQAVRKHLGMNHLAPPFFSWLYSYSQKSIFKIERAKINHFPCCKIALVEIQTQNDIQHLILLKHALEYHNIKDEICRTNLWM